MKFSVIIPVYNKATTVRDSVESVLAQSFQDFEILIVDDGSTDSPEKVLSDLLGPQLCIIRQENSGVSVARNTGLKHANGTYICFLDADDLWYPEHLATLNVLISNYPKAQSFITSHQVLAPEGRILHSNAKLKNYDEDFETDDFLGLLNATSYSVVHTNSVCISKALIEIEKLHFEPKVKIGEDTDFWYRLGLKNTVAVSQQETTIYRREYSTATKVSNHVYDWIFSQRVETLLADNQISEKVKSSIIELIDRYYMTSSREYMAAGDRINAKQALHKVKRRKGKRYLLTFAFTFLPHSLCRRLLK